MFSQTKSTFTIAVCFFFAAVAAFAQSNHIARPLPVNPGIAQLTVVSNRIAALEKKKSEALAIATEAEKLADLKLKAGKISDAQHQAEVQRGRRKFAAEQAAFEKQIAEQQLKEIEIRKSFKLPEPKRR